MVRNGVNVVYKPMMACDYMDKMECVLWSISESKSLQYKSGVPFIEGNYRGLLYTQGFKDCLNFSKVVVKNGIDKAVDGKAHIKGVDCFSAVTHIW